MPTLLKFVELLGPTVVRVAVAPAGLDVPVTDVVLYDPLDPPPGTAGSLLLGIGMPRDASTVVQCLQGHPAAVVLKHEGELDAAVTAGAMVTGTAVLTLAAGTSWLRIAQLAPTLPGQASMPALSAAPGSHELIPDLFDVANAVAARVRAPITIEDTQSRLLAYSAQDSTSDAARAATILGHRVPSEYRAEVRRLGIAKRLLSERAPIYFSSDIPNISPRVVVALRARDELLGSMWAVTDGAFDAERQAAFAEAADQVSLRIWQHRVAADLRREQRTRTLALVLAGGPGGTEAGRRVGLESAGYRLLAATVKGEPTRGRRDIDRLREALSAAVSARHPTAMSADLAHVVYVVLPLAAPIPEGTDEAKDLTRRLRAVLDPDLRDRVVVARSSPVRALAEMPHARDEVQAVLRVLLSPASSRYDADIEEVGLHVALDRLVELQAGRPLLRNRAVDAISAHDARHGTDYLPTLEAHLWSFGDAAAAADRLTVHTNTFRYRLRRLGELFELDLEDPELRFALMLHFRLSQR